MTVQRIALFGCIEPDCRKLQSLLLRHGYLADVLEKGTDIVGYAKVAQPFAIVLDIGNDPKIVLDAIMELRAAEQRVLIIVTGSASEAVSAVESLAIGADDFIMHPVQPAELMMRLEILVARDAPDGIGGGIATRIQEALTSTEQDILSALYEAMPQTLSRDEIMWAVKRQKSAPDDRTLDVHVSHIRKKLSLLHSDFAIETVRGRGFRLTANGEHHARQEQVFRRMSS